MLVGERLKDIFLPSGICITIVPKNARRFYNYLILSGGDLKDFKNYFFIVGLWGLEKRYCLFS